MQKIKIDETSRITIDDHSYILEYKTPKGEFRGKQGIGFKWDIAGYFPDLVSLVQDYVINAPVKQKSSISTLSELVKVIKDAEKHINSLLKLK